MPTRTRGVAERALPLRVGAAPQGGTLCNAQGDLDLEGFEIALRGRLRHYADRLLADRAAVAIGGGRAGQEEWEAPLVALKGLTAAQVRARDRNPPRRVSMSAFHGGLGQPRSENRSQRADFVL